jgi:hypothetical protein
MSAQTSGLKSKQVRNQHEADSTLFSGFLFGLLFDPAYGGDMFLRNTSVHFREAIQSYVPEDRYLHSHQEWKLNI